MARPFISDPGSITASGGFTPFPKLDYSTEHSAIEETFTVPGSSNEFTVRLDYAILQQVGLTVRDETESEDLEFIRWETPAGPGEVAVNHDRGLLRFHTSREGNSFKVTYQPLGSVVDAQFEMTLQKYVQNAVASAVNAAMKNVINTFTEKQTIDTNSANEPILELSALLQPGIKFVDKDSEVDAEIYLSGSIGHFFASHGIDAPFFIGSHSGNGSGLTLINANSISSGTLPDARLSSNVPLKNATQTFSGANTFSSASNSFTGNGSALTSLNASQLTTGTLPDARLSSNVARRDQANTFSALQTFNGGIVEKLTNISSNYSVLASDANIGVNLFGNFTATLPPLSSVPQGKRYRFFILNGHVSYNCTIKGSGSEIVISNAYANTFNFGGNGGKWLDIIASTSTEWVIMPGNQW